MKDNLGTIKVKMTDGNYREADILNAINMDDKDYVIYSLDNGNDTSDIYASRVIVDAYGKPTFFDIDSIEKAEIIKYIQELIKKEV